MIILETMNKIPANNKIPGPTTVYIPDSSSSAFQNPNPNLQIPTLPSYDSIGTPNNSLMLNNNKISNLAEYKYISVSPVNSINSLNNKTKLSLSNSDVTPNNSIYPLQNNGVSLFNNSLTSSNNSIVPLFRNSIISSLNNSIVPTLNNSIVPTLNNSIDPLKYLVNNETNLLPLKNQNPQQVNGTSAPPSTSAPLNNSLLSEPFNLETNSSLETTTQNKLLIFYVKFENKTIRNNVVLR